MGVMGLGVLGGGLAMAAASIEDIDCAVVFCGSCPADVMDPSSLHTPIQCHMASRGTIRGADSEVRMGAVCVPP